MYSVRKERGLEKYSVRFKTPEGFVHIEVYDTREEAKERMRKEIYKLVNKEKEQDILSDSEIEV